MKEALKGIEADLTLLAGRRAEFEQEHERRIQALEDEYGPRFTALDKQAAALAEARTVLLNVNGDGPGDADLRAGRDAAIGAAPEDEPAPDLRSKKRKPTVAAAERIEGYLRNNGGEAKTELQLGEAAGLHGRGSGPVREAAVRLLVDEGKLVEANHTSGDGSPLYTWAG